MYCLPEGYNHRLKNDFFDDTPFETDFYQKEVYEDAETIFRNRGYHLVVDVGCGSAFKLLKHFKDTLTIGFDMPATVSWLNNKYPERVWEVPNFKRPATTRGGLIICADVIEHIPNPDELMNWLYSMQPECLIISTPARDELLRVQDGCQELGPPVNPCHVREWTFYELELYVKPWFKIDEHYISNKEQGTQCLVCYSQ